MLDLFAVLICHIYIFMIICSWNGEDDNGKPVSASRNNQVLTGAAQMKGFSESDVGVRLLWLTATGRLVAAHCKAVGLHHLLSPSVLSLAFHTTGLSWEWWSLIAGVTMVLE